MDSNLYQKVEKIYYRVLEEKPENVRSFVVTEAGGNQDIVKEVMSLLSIDDYKTYNKTSNNILSKLSDIIENQSGGFKSDKYKLVRKIGEGGMGSVYLANRIGDEVEQKVAIKLINGAFMTQANIDRFKKERQILASLNHENIARFIDAGTSESGVMFVVMEYIDGISFKQYCTDEKLSVKQKFLLFLQLCKAVDYAHKNFIIHRDIKPTNILVTQDGNLKLLDFGIAKLVDDDAQQMVATVTKVMTPAYASPEQLLGKNITIQSDIYALGVVLFEVLVGMRPYQNFEVNPHTFQLKVINGINTKPSQLINDFDDSKMLLISKQVLKGDIDAILTKVINPDIKRRYETVVALVSDINNYLKGFPLKARKPNSWYFLKLFIYRNKLISGLSVASFTIIMGFSVYSYLQYEKLKVRTIELLEQRDEAVLQAKKAKLASDFLLDSFQTADPTRTFGEKLTIKKVMQDSYQKLKHQPLDDNILNAGLYHTISQAFYGMDANDLAFEAASNGLIEILDEKDSQPLLYVKLLIDRAKGYYVKRNYLFSLKDLDEALSVCYLNVGIDDCLIDEIYLFKAKNHSNMGNKDMAVEHVHTSLIWLDGKQISGLRYARKLIFLARVENNLKQPIKALKNITKIKQLISLDNKQESYYYLNAELQNIRSLQIQKQHTQVGEKLEKVFEYINTKFGNENILYIEAATFKAVHYLKLKQYDKTIVLLNEIIAIKEKLNLNIAAEKNKIGNVYYYQLQNYQLAIDYYQQAVDLDRENVPVATSNSGFYIRNLAFAYYKNGNNKQTLNYLMKAKETFKTLSQDEYAVTLKGLDEWIVFINEKLLDKT